MKHTFTLLCLVLLAWAIPQSLRADESGTCGTNMTWYLESASGTLIISGEGAMVNFRSIYDVPWIYSSSGIREVIIPNSVTSIGDYAFAGCSSLTAIDIPNSVTSIGKLSFDGCGSLTAIDIPSSVASIGKFAFNGCSSLTAISIPSSVTSIGEYAFNGSSGLAAIKVDEANGVYDSRDNCNAIVKTSANELILGCQNTTIPSSVTSIGDGAFANCRSLTAIAIPSSVMSIGEEAFAGCRSLTAIDIPSSVASIGKFAFWNCNSLTSIKVDEANGAYDSRDNCNAIINSSTNKLILGCQRTVIPSSVTSIGEYAFYECSLTAINIPSSVTNIEKRAFSACSSLTAIDLPSSLTSIGEYAFSACSSLTAIDLPSSLTSIGSAAFFNCSNLTAFSLPNSVTSIENHVFSDCSSLTTISIPSSVTSIGAYAFSGCISLTTIDLPSSVTNIGEYAFWSCISLTSIYCNATIPPTVDGRTFYDMPLASCVLNVPGESISAYQQADVWKEFSLVASIPTSLGAAKNAKGGIESERYNLGGQRVHGRPRGVNVIRYSDGSTRKVCVK